MMMKVALLLLALAASVISTRRDCPWAAGKVLAKCGDHCSDSTPAGLQRWAQGCCAKCPKLKCHRAWEKIDHKRCRNCDNLRDLAIKWKCKKPHSGYGGYGHGGGGGYSGGEWNYGVDYKGASYCAEYGGYGIGKLNEKHNNCNNYEQSYNYAQDKYSSYHAEKNVVCGYGQQYGECDKCMDKDHVPEYTQEYVYRGERCKNYGTPPPTYEPKKCPTCKPPVYDKETCGVYNTCPSIPDNYCQENGYRDAALDSSGETTNETVQTLSWVLIAIAAALFLASIAFCAVGRRERKAHAAENVHVNALA